MKQQRLLQHEADLLPQRRLLELPYIDSVDLHRAGGGVVEARHQAGDGRLSRPGRTHQRRHLSRLDAKAHVAQHRRLGIVAERHMVEFDAAFKRWSLHGAGQVLHIALGLHHFLYAFPRHRRLGVGIGHLRKLLHRLVHLSQIQDEHNQRTCREATVQNHARAEPEHHAGAAGHDHFHDRRKLRLQAARAQRDADAFHALYFVAPLLIVLPCEGPHHAHRRKHLVDDRHHLAFFFAHRARGFLDLARVGEDHPEQQRHNRKRDQRELPVDVEHDADHAAQRKDADQRTEQPRRQKALHRIDIAGHAADQVTGLLSVVVRQRKSLNLRVECPPHLVQHPLADRHSQRLFGIRTAGAQRRDRQHRQSRKTQNRQRLVSGKPQDDLVQPPLARVPLQHRVDNDLQRPGLQQVRDTASGHHQDSQRQGLEMGA